MKILKKSKFYWFFGLAIFIIFAILLGINGQSLNLKLQYVLSFLISSSWSISLILMMIKRRRPWWWIGSIVSFWLGFISIMFNLWSFGYLFAFVCIILAGIAYYDNLKNGPYKFKNK